MIVLMLFCLSLLFFCLRPEPTNFLIKNNASVNAVDKVNRNSPLHCAVLAGNVDAAHILLEAGASVDAENINVSLGDVFSLRAGVAVRHPHRCTVLGENIEDVWGFFFFLNTGIMISKAFVFLLKVDVRHPK